MKIPTKKQEIGRVGENLAVEFLKGKGFMVKDRNYRRPWGEIDIVAIKEGIVRFVEVKTVTWHGGRGCVIHETDNWEPEDNIHPWKLKRLYRIMETYISSKYGDDEPDYQLDALAVYVDESGNMKKIDFLEDIG